MAAVDQLIDLIMSTKAKYWNEIEINAHVHTGRILKRSHDVSHTTSIGNECKAAEDGRQQVRTAHNTCSRQSLHPFSNRDDDGTYQPRPLSAPDAW